MSDSPAMQSLISNEGDELDDTLSDSEKWSEYWKANMIDLNFFNDFGDLFDDRDL